MTLHSGDRVEAANSLSDGTNDDRIIACSFNLASLSDPLEYEALSYVWGDPKDLSPISLEGHQFPLTKNLRYALLHLQRETEERVPCVDALCINQGSMDERGSQVAQMQQHICGSASMVVAFLGEGWGGAETAVNYIERVGSDPNLHIDPAFDLHAQCHVLNIRSPLLYAHLHRFYYLPWFTRIWTVQKFVLACEIIFVCGQRPIHGTVLQDFMANMIMHTRHCCDTILPAMTDMTNLIALKYTLEKIGSAMHFNICLGKGTSYVDFILLLVSLKLYDSFDLRDRMYGLLSLVELELQRRMLPNHNITVAEVYTGVVTHIIDITKSLDILSCITWSKERPHDLPSFVPDWSSHTNRTEQTTYVSRLASTFSGNCMAWHSSRLPTKSLRTPSAT
jgi:hypothetical protein